MRLSLNITASDARAASDFCRSGVPTLRYHHFCPETEADQTDRAGDQRRAKHSIFLIPPTALLSDAFPTRSCSPSQLRTWISMTKLN
jgi:hypothetical protein